MMQFSVKQLELFRSKTIKKLGIRIALPIFILFFLTNFSIVNSILRIFGSLPPQSMPKVAVSADGKAVTNIPIELPPGTKGIQPKLSISYISDSGDGILGWGWILEGNDFIARDPSFGVNYNGSDSFLSTLSGQLVDISGGAKTTYHSRKETLVRYIPNGTCGDGPCSWTATDRTGLTYTFGGTQDSNIPAIGQTSSIRVWALSKVQDPFGNNYTVQYTQDGTGGYYPNTIAYNNRTIQFSYETRPDSISEYSQGSLVKLSQRLNTISIYTNGSLLRQYEFGYTQGSVTGRSLLAWVRRDGNNNFGNESYDDIEFTYNSEGSSGFSILNPFSYFSSSNTGFSTAFASNPLLVLSGPNNIGTAILPSNPNNKPQLIELDFQYSVKMPVPNRSACNWGFGACLCALLPVCNGGNVSFSNFLGAQCYNFGTWGGLDACNNGITTNLTAWLPMDVNGDGVQDFVALTGDERSNSIILSGQLVQNGVQPVQIQSLSIPIHYNTFFSAVDLNGDNRTDFVFENGGNLSVLYSLGTHFSAPVTFGNVSLVPADGSMTNFDPYEYVFRPVGAESRTISDKPTKDFFADMNSDGLADFIHNDGSNFQIYINKNGSFASPVSISGGVSSYMNQFVDINGDGIAEYVNLSFSSSNSGIQQLQTQLNQDNATYSVMQTDYNNQVATLNKVNSASSIANLPSNTSLQSLIQYYTTGGNSSDAQTIQNIIGGTTPLPLSSTAQSALTKDLSASFATISGPVLLDISNTQAAIGQALASNLNITYKLNVTYFNLSTSTSVVQAYSVGSPDPYRSFLQDINADGRPDFITINGTTASASLNIGNGFSTQSNTSLNSNNSDSLLQFNFGDVNGDRYADLVLYNKDSQQIETYLSNGKGFGSLSSKYSYGSLATRDNTGSGGGADLYQITLQDINRDSSPDVSVVFLPLEFQSGTVQVRYSATRTSSEDSLSTVSNGWGQSISLSYGLASNQTGGVNVGSGAYPNLPNIIPTFVVTSLVEDYTNGVTDKSLFSYQNSRVYAGVPGIARSLGFATVQEIDVNTNFYNVTTYFQNDYRLAGEKSSESKYNTGGKLIQQTIHSGFIFPNPYGTEIALPTNSSSSRYQDGSIYLTSNQSVVYDTYGNPTSSTQTSGSHTSVTQNTYLNDTSKWRMGRVLETITKVDGGLTSDTLLSYSVDVISSKTEFPGTSASLTTSYAYDSFGNPISVTDPSGSTTTISYDPTLNLFQTKKVNALGHTSTIAYDIDLGLPISATDPNGATTVKTYDPYKRPLTITYPGESGWNESFSYNNVGKFNLSNLSQNESITKQKRDNITGTVSTLTSYIDPLGNEVRSEANTSSPNVFIINESKYDYAKKVLIQKSNPYVTGVTPSYITYSYNHPDNLLSSVQSPDPTGNILTNITYSGLTTSISTAYPDGSIRNGSQTKNELGQIISKNDNGKTLTYTYESHGHVSTATDPEGNVTSYTYDLAGRKVGSSDPNSGSVQYSFDPGGRLYKQTDARGKSLTFSYDSINRISSLLPSGGEPPISYAYDDTSNPYGIGRVFQITDGTGTTQYKYNLTGKVIEQRRTIDDLIVFVRASYDSLGRPISITYPEGTKVYNNYSVNNYISTVTMDSADGTSTGYTVASYNGPILGNSNPTIRRTTGNGVTMDISFDPIQLRPLELLTRKSDGTTLNDVSYSYDSQGNMIAVTDKVNSQRSETYSFDSWNRLIQATGVYGSQSYSYSSGGKLIQKGNYSLSYSDSNHVSAVTQSNSASTGTISYSYDASGNMISRNGDSIRYDSFGKMVEYDPQGGGQILYSYDFSGSRVKTVSTTAGTTTYSFGDMYEIVRVPSQPEKHTLYIKGNQNDLVAQFTRTNAVLISSSSNNSVNIASSNLTDKVCLSMIGGNCKGFWNDTVKKSFLGFFAYSAFFRSGIPTDSFASLYYVFLLVVLYIAYPLFRKGNEILKRAKVFGIGSPVLLLSFVIVFSVQNCNGFLGGGGKGSPPWLIPGAASSDPSTPSISNPLPAGTAGINAGASPVQGMYFFHPDHLGSTSMITDGYGNPAPGPGQTGVSHVTYDPYGQVVRNDSSGPDIFRYKFTGQIEDQETGLYYYKARHYDPALGRFIEADTLTDISSVNGMDKYMYVGGNPVQRIDPSGHSWLSSAISGLGKSLLGGLTGLIAGIGRSLTTLSKLSFANLGKTLAHTDYGVGLTKLGYDLRHSDIGKLITRNRNVIYGLLAAPILIPTAAVAVSMACITDPVGVMAYLGGGLSKSSFAKPSWNNHLANKGFQNGTKVQLGLDAIAWAVAGAIEFGIVDAVVSGFETVMSTIDAGTEWLGENWGPFTDAVERNIDKLGESVFRLIYDDYDFGWIGQPGWKIPFRWVPFYQGLFAYGASNQFNYSNLTLKEYLKEVGISAVEDIFTIFFFNEKTLFALAFTILGIGGH